MRFMAAITATTTMCLLVVAVVPHRNVQAFVRVSPTRLKSLRTDNDMYRRSRNILLDQAPEDGSNWVTIPIDEHLRRSTNGKNTHVGPTTSTITTAASSLPLIDLHTKHHQNDAVSAILAASKEAVILAEATLWKDSLATFPDPSGTIPTATTVANPPQPLTLSRTTYEDTIIVEDIVVAPSVRKIIRFAIPAMGVWLCNPLLSLIDTSVVGLYAGTIQQAALNPAVAVTDYTALLMAFLFTGTTNLIAAAHTHDSKKGSVNSATSSRTSTTLMGVLKLSTYAGLTLTALLLALAKPLLQTLIGNDSISPDIFRAAMKYVQIRALGMPAAALIGSAQAACLGIQDIQSPLYVLLAAAVVNFVGDLVLVGSSHPWLGGAAGAAWATVLSQYAAATMFVYWLRHKKSVQVKSIQMHESDIGNSRQYTNKGSALNLSKAILELTSDKSNCANIGRRRRFVDAVRSLIVKPMHHQPQQEMDSSLNGGARSVDHAVSARGFLEGKLRKRDIIAFPNKETMKQFAPYVVPVTTTVIGRLSGYIAMSHVVSSSFGTISMAAQQVIVSLFYCLCPIADSLSLTAQSFVPSISESASGPERSNAMKQTAKNFYMAGGIAGSIIVAAVCCIPLLSGLFTSDANVISLVNMVLPYLIGFFAVHGFVCGVEGLLLGQKDLGFLGKMYAGFFFVVPTLMLQVKRAASAATSGTMINLTSVWKIMVGYQLFRSVAWSSRLAHLERRTEMG